MQSQDYLTKNTEALVRTVNLFCNVKEGAVKTTVKVGFVVVIVVLFLFLFLFVIIAFSWVGYGSEEC